MGVHRRPQRTPYPQEESLQHLAIDHITGVNASRGPIHSRPCATLDQHPDASPWVAPKESHIKLPVAKNRFGQVHPHCLQCLPLGLVDSHGKYGPQQELSPAESKRHPFRVRGSDAEAGNENAPALVRSCGNFSINYVLHQLDTINRVPFARPPSIFRSKIIGQPSCRVKVWGGTPDMLREFRNSMG